MPPAILPSFLAHSPFPRVVVLRQEFVGPLSKPLLYKAFHRLRCVSDPEGPELLLCALSMQQACPSNIHPDWPGRSRLPCTRCGDVKSSRKNDPCVCCCTHVRLFACAACLPACLLLVCLPYHNAPCRGACPSQPSSVLRENEERPPQLLGGPLCWVRGVRASKKKNCGAVRKRESPGNARHEGKPLFSAIETHIIKQSASCPSISPPQQYIEQRRCKNFLLVNRTGPPRPGCIVVVAPRSCAKPNLASLHLDLRGRAKS